MLFRMNLINSCHFGKYLCNSLGELPFHVFLLYLKSFVKKIPPVVQSNVGAFLSFRPNWINICRLMFNIVFQTDLNR